jgi:hypothetical protein
MNSSATALHPIAAVIAGLASAAGAKAKGVLDARKGEGGSEVRGAAGDLICLVSSPNLRA